MPRAKPTALVADDERSIVRLIKSELELAGYGVFVAQDGDQAVELARRHVPDLIVLDIMMPGRDGFAVCREVREFCASPILVLSARGREQDKVHALNLGADDYLTKPFGVAELMARVRAIVRRSRANTERVEHDPVRSGNLLIDFASGTVSKEGRPVKLTATEYKVLCALATRAGRTVLHDTILTGVWGESYSGQIEYLWVYIGRLRNKLELDPNRPLTILTVPGIGYRFEPAPACSPQVPQEYLGSV